MGNDESRSVEVAEAEAMSDDDLDLDWDVDNKPSEDSVPDGKCCGFRVLGMQEHSPAASAGFVSFFDFIMAANGIRVDTRDATLMEIIAQSEDQDMLVQVFNTKAQQTREVVLRPSRQWAGKGLLGVTIRFDSFEHTEDELLHVLRVASNSPAAKAGLRAGTDYLLGTPERGFRDPNDLQDEILAYENSSFQCYVYNAEDDQVRLVRIAPREGWGDGGGLLGAEVAHGVLHRLPSACRQTLGTSVGFVSLSDQVSAATDPFLRKKTTRQEPPPEPASAPELLSEQTSTQVAPAAAEDAEKHSKDEVSTFENQEQVQHTETPPTESGRKPNARPETTPTAAETTLSMPRYAASVDPTFPISMVQVYVDPLHPE